MQFKNQNNKVKIDTLLMSQELNQYQNKYKFVQHKRSTLSIVKDSDRSARPPAQ